MKPWQKIQLPKDGKNALLWASALILVYFFLRWTINYFKKLRQENGLNSQLNQAIQGQNLSFPVVQYALFADQFQEELEDLIPNTSSLVNILSRFKTKDDWFQLVKAFGNRKMERFVLGNWEGSLIVWLTRRLNNDQEEKINQELTRLGLALG